MKIEASIIISTVLLLVVFSIAAARMKTVEAEPAVETSSSPAPKSATEKFDGVTIEKSDAEWKKLLTREQYYILREKGTEQPFTGALDKNHAHGTYHCAA